MIDTGNKHPCPARTPLRLGNNGTLYPSHFDPTRDQIYGTLEPRDIQLLELFSREEIEFELMWMACTIDGKKAEVWVTLYGPQDIAADLSDLFQTLGLYLQDPVHALRDAPYFNPQRFFNRPDIRTTDFQAVTLTHPQISTAKDEDIVATDVLNSFISLDTLDETHASSHVLTELKRHQKQGLTFMIQPELGWRLHDKDQDVWSQEEVNNGLARIAYINNIDLSTRISYIIEELQ
ncbi:hypothetical protein EDB80DRAFT_867377 [Ilyonectria destructans]|nr:hypothetical protein EDB80DRAFT_867377 [Ilyonectria destructans]